MHWSQILLLMFLFIWGSNAIIHHGLVTRYNAWHTITQTLVVCALLWAGSFWNVSHAQIPPAANHYQRTLTRAAHSQWGLNAPIAAMAAQVHQESAWNPQAVSRVGARGLAQFMPATATWWCQMRAIARADCLPHNPTWALRAMVGYDKFLYDRTPARMGVYDRYWLALRAYNGGAANWQAEAAATGLKYPTRQQIDAACGQARRARMHCAENLGYPQRILQTLQPRYRSWGAVMMEPEP